MYKIGQTFGKLTNKEIEDIATFCNNDGNCHLFCIDDNHYEIRDNKPVVISEKEQLQNEKREIEQWLRKHDYIGVKIATGRATIEEYADIIALMNEKANRINEINESLNEHT